MTTVYVLSESNFYRKELWTEILSVHTTFESAYKELVRVSDSQYDPTQFDDDDVIVIQQEINVENKYYINGKIFSDKMKKVIERGDLSYDEGFCGTFIRDTINNEFCRIYNDHVFTVTPKILISD